MMVSNLVINQCHVPYDQYRINTVYYKQSQSINVSI